MLNFFKTKTFKVASFVIAFAVMFTLTASAYTFSGPTMKKGSMGGEVAELQTLVGAVPDGNFGPATHAKVATWQAANGLTVDGIFGKMSMAKANGGSVATGGTVALCPDGTTVASYCKLLPGATTGGTTGGMLTGGAGSVDTYSLVGGLANEEVGENENDIKVYGLEVEADDSSDLKFTAMKLVFDENTGATADFEDYADEVSIWMGSTEVARVDADSFTDDNSWTKTVSFSKDAIVKAGKTEQFYVAISGVNNLDSNDAGDMWDLDVTSVRFMDGQGAVTSEDPTENEVVFSFETFATSSDMELKISEGDTKINEAHTIDLDSSDDTDDVELLSFNIEAEGDSDVVIDSLPITVTTTETTGNDPDDLASAFSLWADGKEIGKESTSSSDADDSSEVVVFDNLDFTMDAGKTVKFTIKADLVSTGDTLDNGDTIQVTFGETETDLSTFDAEDTNGDNLADGDKTGTVTGGTHTVYDSGVKVTMGTPTITPTANTTTGEITSVAYTIPMTVKAFGSTLYFGQTAQNAATASASNAFAFVFQNSGAPGTTDSSVTVSGITLETSDATLVTNGYRLDEDKDLHFTVKATLTAGTNNTSYRVHVKQSQTFTEAGLVTGTARALSPDVAFRTGFQLLNN